MKNIKSYTVLRNGVKMPWLGFGTYKLEEENITINSVKEALKIGYRHIDTASFYDNEKAVGTAIKESNVPREEIFLVSKVWKTDQGYDKTLKAFESSIKKLGTDYLDLYLIHWPSKMQKETWKALEKLYKEKRIRAIGVSNFTVNQLKNLMEDAEIMPAVNQIEFHPKLIQNRLIEFCKNKNIQLEAWSPLMRGKVFKIQLLKDLSLKYEKTIAQIILKWNLQMGFVTIPKSTTPWRIKENADIFDFRLTIEDIGKINSLNEGLRIGSDPDKVYECKEIIKD